MSALEEELCREVNRLPTHLLDHAFWLRKLPPGFRFYLQMVARRLMLSRPADLPLVAAQFFEELRAERTAELGHLPPDPYFHKLKKKLGVPASPQPPAKSPLPFPLTGPSDVRCARCGRDLPFSAAQAGETTHMEGDEECRVIALPLKKDAFGRVLARSEPREKSMEAVSTRSLAYVVDY